MRRPRRGRRVVYTFVSNEALATDKRKVKALTGRSTTSLELSELLRALNPVLRGWAAYFRYAAAKRTLSYLGYYSRWRVVRWLRKKHPHVTWKQLRRRYFGKDGIRAEGIMLYNPAAMRITRYRYRGGGSRRVERGQARSQGRASGAPPTTIPPSSTASKRRSRDRR